MPALNRVQLIGKVGRNPESHFTPSGKKVTQFGITVSNQWSGPDGGTKEYTEWVNIEAGAAGRGLPGISRQGQPDLPGRPPEDQQVRGQR